VKFTIGPYPAITLTKARELGRDAILTAKQGRDPSAERKEARRKAVAARADTLAGIAEEYLTKTKDLRTIGQRRRLLERLVLPTLGSRPIGEIRRVDIIRLLDRIENQNGARSADYVLACIRRLFNWFAVRDDNFCSPIVKGMARQNAREHARERTLTDDELRRVWAAAEQLEGPFGPLAKFLLLTGARRSEAADMTDAEIDGSDWALPAGRNKVKATLVRPLSKAAQAVLAKVPRIADSNFVFTVDGSRPIHGFHGFKKKLDAQSGVTGWVLHDLRRTARSLMSRAGVNSDIAERCLGHVLTGVRATYDRHEFHREKQLAFEALAAQIERIVHPQDNVVAVRGRR
jgi:integrase